jgi:cytochrome c oxidase subunit 2
MTFAQITFYPEQGSTVAPWVDAVFLYTLGVSVFFSVLIAGLIVTFAVRYRRRSPDEVPPRVKGSLRLEIFWMVVPLLIVSVMFVWGASVFFAAARPPDDATEVFVVGRQWMWKVQHPEGQREINTLHVPVGKPIKVILTSEDVIHSFYVPAFRIKQDAVPGRYTYTWFQATEAKTYRLFCAEYCGTEHSKMIGEVVAMEPADYQRWLTSGSEGSLALQGRKLFTKLQCVTCHTGDGTGRGPSLENLYGRRVPLQGGGTADANENYLRESIRLPQARLVAGYQPIMPAYTHELATEEELVRVVAFLKTLGTGQTPPRVEDTPPPEALAGQPPLPVLAAQAVTSLATPDLPAAMTHLLTVKRFQEALAREKRDIGSEKP